MSAAQRLILVAVAVACLLGLVSGLNSTAGWQLKQPRQYSSAYSSNYASPSLYATSPLEAIVVGVLAVCGLTLFGIPLLLLLFNLLTMNSNPGMSVIPTATTSVNTGRRKRSATNLLDQHTLARVMDSLNTFVQSEQKMQLLQSLISGS